MSTALGGIQVMLLSSCASEQHAGDTVDGSQSLLHQDKKTQSTLFAQRALQERRLKPPDQIIACPRCQSLNTKFCYYNNYSLTQPRHFCKNCRRYWTAGGTLRNVPVGGGCRKNKRAKQRNNELSSVLTVDSSASGMRSDGGGSALHTAYNPASASSSAGYYEHQYDIDPAKVVLARAQQSIRAGPSGVSQSTETSGISSNGHVSAFSVTHGHGSQSTGMSHSAQSTYESAGIIGLGFFPSVKQDVAALANGDLSAIFETTQNFRAAAAAAAAAGGGPALSEGLGYSIDLEHLNGIDPADVQWRLQAAQKQQQQQQQQQVGMWGSSEEDQERRGEGRQVIHHVDEKGLMESLRHAKGKSAMAVPSSNGGEGEPETSRPLTLWQPVPETLQSFEPVSHDSAFWTNQSWPPLDLHALNANNTNSQLL